MKLGVFGGSFNPPHIGHLIIVETVRDNLQLDKVLFIPASQNPNKFDRKLAPANMRLEMTQLAIKGSTNYFVSDIEIRRKGISYTIDTLNQLSVQYPIAKLFLLIGTDNLMEFETWKEPDEILSKAVLIAMNRPGFKPFSTTSKFSRSVEFVNVPQIGISGTEIRKRVKLGRSIRYLVPKLVEDYIVQKKLYQE